MGFVSHSAVPSRIQAGSPIDATEVSSLREAIDAADEKRPVSWVSVLPIRDTPVRLSRGRVDAVTLDDTDLGRWTIGLRDLLASAQRDVPVRRLPRAQAEAREVDQSALRHRVLGSGAHGGARRVVDEQHLPYMDSRYYI